ncbi:hypothetical protein A0U90_06920 [Kozakia baliensis]|nr:hypothetical protein A0U90_06920 [Kozakia baliensis]
MRFWPTCLNSARWKKVRQPPLPGWYPLRASPAHGDARSFIQGGRATLRQVLYMPAIVAMRFNPDVKRVYDRLIAKGKHAKIATTAIM